MKLLLVSLLVVVISVRDGENARRRGKPKVKKTVARQTIDNSSDVLLPPEYDEEIIRETSAFSSRILLRLSDLQELEDLKPVPGCTLILPSDEEKEQLISFHNSKRRKVAKGLELRGYGNLPQPKAGNMMAMGYSRLLEKMAIKWASRCNRFFDKHYVIDQYKSIWQTILSRSAEQPIPPFDLRRAAHHRYHSKVVKFYGPDALRPFYGRNSLTGDDVRGYAIMVNHDTRSMACAQAAFFNDTDKRYYRMAICNYGDGYRHGKPLYEEGKPCSAVPPYYCDNGIIMTDLSALS